MQSLASRRQVTFGPKLVADLCGELHRQIHHALESEDPQSIHDLRVQIRKFRQAMSAFRPLFPPAVGKALRRSLKRILKLAGGVRNCDISLELTRGPKIDRGVVLERKLRLRRKRTAVKLRSALESWLASPPPARAERVTRRQVATCANHRLQSAAKEFFNRGKVAVQGDDAKDLHKFRVASKKFRYTLELLAPQFAPPSGLGISQAKDIQSALGHINDYRTARELIAEEGGGELIDTQLKQRQVKRIRSFREDWAAQLGAKQRRVTLAALPEITPATLLR